MTKRTPLEKWIFEKGMTITGFCKENNLNYPTIYNIIKGKTMPTRGTLQKVIQATNREVSTDDIIFPK